MAHTRRDVHPTLGYIAITPVALGELLGNPAMRPAEVLEILHQLHLTYHQYDLVHVAQQCCGMRYRRNALRSARPRTFDCSTLVQFIYAHAGYWLPRYTHLIVDHGEKVGPPYQPGDLLFTTGRGAWRHPDYAERIGHVAMVTRDELCVHADNVGTKTVVEVPIAKIQGPIIVAKRLLQNIHECGVANLPSHLLWVHTPGELEALVRKHLQTHRPRSH